MGGIALKVVAFVYCAGVYELVLLNSMNIVVRSQEMCSQPSSCHI